MIVGENFAFGHIPKTGGDAVHAWLSQLDDVTVDSIHDPRKHDFFWQRDLDKAIYALSIRRLPAWHLSYLHELGRHPESALRYGIPPDDTVRPEHALALQADHYIKQFEAGGRRIACWLRMENLLDDVLRFVDRYVERVTPIVRARMAVAQTKGQRDYNHDVHEFFTPHQIEQLYVRNPRWRQIEARVYGSLPCDLPASLLRQAA